MKKPFAVGVESIGSRYTFCVVLDEGGEVLAATRHSGHICYNEQSPAQVATRLYRVITRSLATLECSGGVEGFLRRGGRVAAGITGAPATRGPSEGMDEIWQRLEFPIEQCVGTGAAEILLLGMTGSLTGASALWNAGSVAYARRAGGPGISVGGWGPMVGDEGGGFYIGLRALRAVTWHTDKLAECPELIECVHERLAKSQDEWGRIWRDLPPPAKREDGSRVPWADKILDYCKELLAIGTFRYAVAELVPAVVEAAGYEFDKQKGTANSILTESADLVAERVDRAIANAGLDPLSTFDVALGGGVLVHNNDLRDMLWRRITKNHPNAKSRVIPEGPVCHTGGGAALLALVLDRGQGRGRSVDCLPLGFVGLAERVRTRSTELLAESIGMNVQQQGISA